jgi:glycosyltransferase involved in cell wall biosynthesis
MIASSPRVLLVAYQCGPGMGSVSQIGWEWYARLARRTPVTLVTHVRNRAALTAAGAPVAGSEIIYIDTEWFAAPLYRIAKRLFRRSEHSVFLVSSLDYFVFDAALRRALRARPGNWDLVHRVTPVTPSAPTRLPGLGLPTIVGPLNGGLPGAPAFPELMREERSLLRHLRELPRILDALWGSTRRTTTILFATRATRASYPKRYQHKLVPMIENGVDLNCFTSTPWPAAPTLTAPLRILFVGRLVPVKGVPMLLDAVARLAAGHPVRLDIAGDGPLRCELEATSRALGLEDIVTFHGALPLPAVARLLRDAHVFCLPSVRESGGAVLLEAMASARPVIAIDFGGPAEIVDAAVGAALPPAGRAAVTAALVATFDDVIADPAGWRQRGLNGLERARARYGWAAKVDAALALYRGLLTAPTPALRPGPAAP